MRNRLADERGSMIVLVGLSLVALLGLAGLVIDGGRAYASHRTVQNAADAAALAGADALNGILFDSVGHERAVHDAVVASVAANGANGTTDCRLVDQTHADLGPCPTSNSGAGLPATVAGVTAVARENSSGSFIKVVGIPGFSTQASASAQIQALRAGSSPFMICGLDAGSDGFDPPLLIASGSTWAINQAAINQTYGIHGPQVPACGAGSNSFKGLVDDGTGYAIPGWWPGDTGVKAGPVRNRLARPDACTTKEGFDTSGGCTLVVPMCVDGRGQGHNADLYCVRFGAFRIYQAHANRHEAVFLGPAVVTTGQGGGKPVANEARVIKLTA